MKSAMGDTASVVGPNSAVIAIIHMIDFKTAGEVLLIGLSIGYTLWRWRRDYKNKKGQE